MRDYQDLFFYKSQKEKLENIINEIGALRCNLEFYEDISTIGNVDNAFTELYKVYKSICKKVDSELKNFTSDELIELHLKYKEYKNKRA